jgi:hypothetical protein
LRSPFSRSRLLLGSCWPLILLGVAGACFITWELTQEFGQRSFARARVRAVRKGIQRVLPLTLLVTFLLVPSTSTRIYKTFLCDSFDYDGGKPRRCETRPLELAPARGGHRAFRLTLSNIPRRCRPSRRFGPRLQFWPVPQHTDDCGGAHRIVARRGSIALCYAALGES